ncbi:MAG: ATP-binding protein [Candidatus Omnitrophica bacterium]|nr:ATP-binding protein [Candidatus Omnitrophota bacterium]
MNHIAISGLLIFITSLFSAIFVSIKGPKKDISYTWSLFSLSVASWGFGLFKGFTTNLESVALFWSRYLNLSAIFIPLFFFHFVISFTGRFLSKRKELFCCYIFVISYFLISAIFSKAFVYDVRPILSFKYYPRPGILYYLFPIIFAYLVIYGIILLFKELIRVSSFRKNQIKYLFFGISIGFAGGSTTFLPVFNIKIYPFGTYLVTIYVLTVTYAIIKHRLMDIKVAITRVGIFCIVYSVVLGIPFGLSIWGRAWLMSIFGLYWFLVPMFILLGLAHLGPFIYAYLRRHAEDVLLKDQRRYQRALLELSKNISQIRDLDKLAQAIDLTVVEQVKVSFSCIYLIDEEYRSFHLKHCFPPKEKFRFQEFIPPDHPLIEQLNQYKRPLSSEEVIPQDKIQLDLGLIIPCFIEDTLLGFMVLGPKQNNQIYTPDDLLIFEALSYAVVLAIENSQFWKEIEEHQRQSRIADMDLCSYSVAHEIDNPMSAIKTAALYLKDYFLKELNLSAEKQKEMEDALSSILKDQDRVSGMIKVVEEFGKKTAGEFSPLRLEEVLKSYIELYLPQFKYHGIIFNQEIPQRIPYLKGSKQELMQVLVNLSNNSILALLGNKERIIALTIEIPNQDFIRVIFKDNGYGISQEKLRSIFAPFTTTKASTEGRGMGLYTVRRIIRRHNGRIRAESEGEGKAQALLLNCPLPRT